MLSRLGDYSNRLNCVVYDYLPHACPNLFRFLSKPFVSYTVASGMAGLVPLTVGAKT